jgi:hypothetical protein
MAKRLGHSSSSGNGMVVARPPPVLSDARPQRPAGHSTSDPCPAGGQTRSWAERPWPAAGARTPSPAPAPRPRTRRLRQTTRHRARPVTTTQFSESVASFGGGVERGIAPFSSPPPPPPPGVPSCSPTVRSPARSARAPIHLGNCGHGACSAARSPRALLLGARTRSWPGRRRPGARRRPHLPAEPGDRTRRHRLLRTCSARPATRPPGRTAGWRLSGERAVPSPRPAPVRSGDRRVPRRAHLDQAATPVLPVCEQRTRRDPFRRAPPRSSSELSLRPHGCDPPVDTTLSQASR